MKKYILTAALLMTGCVTSAFAQDRAIPASAKVAFTTAKSGVLRTGTEVPLLILEELTTKHKALRVGQRIRFEVASNIESGGVVIIPAGTPAVGEVTQVRNKGMWGKSGYIAGRVTSLRLPDRTIRLTGSFDDKGVTGTGGVVAAVVFVPIAGFFATGTSASIPPGASVKGFLDEDVTYYLNDASSLPAVAPLSVKN